MAGTITMHGGIPANENGVLVQTSSNPSNPTIFIQKLDTVGDGSGTVDQSVDGSVTPVTFRIKPAAGQVFQIERLIFYIEDNASLDSGGWGALGGTPLTNGCLIQKKQNGVTNVGITVKSNGELAGVTYDMTRHDWGAGNEFLVARLSFNKFGGGIKLIGDNEDEVMFTVRDDLTGLVQQYVNAEGWIEDTAY